MTALKRVHDVKSFEEAMGLMEVVAQLQAECLAAWKPGGAGLPGQQRIMGRLAKIVPSGYYSCSVDFDQLAPSEIVQDVAVFGTAKNEITHQLFVIVLRKGDACVPVPVDRFMALSEDILMKQPAKPAELMQDFLPQLTKRTKFGGCRHISSTAKNPRNYLVLGSLIDPSNGTELQLYHESRDSFSAGLRVRPVYGERGFSSKRSEHPRGMRFSFIEAMQPHELIAAVKSHH